MKCKFLTVYSRTTWLILSFPIKPETETQQPKLSSSATSTNGKGPFHQMSLHPKNIIVCSDIQEAEIRATECIYKTEAQASLSPFLTMTLKLPVSNSWPPT
jgi:hypothetical protein